MNILLINHYAGTPIHGMEYRPYYMCNEWRKTGHDVLILAASFSHVRAQQFLFSQNFNKYEIEGVNYLIFKTPKYKGNNISRILNIMAFIYQLFRYKKLITKLFKPDIVIASSTYPFDIYPAKSITEICKAKLIYEVHDLWPLSPMEFAGYSKWHPYIMIMQIAENYAYKNADKTVSILPKAKGYMIEHGLREDKFVYIPNGILPEQWETEAHIPEDIISLIEKLKKDKKTLIGYSGSHGLANALHSLVDAMKLLEDEDIHLLLIGKGIQKESLIEQSLGLKLNNITFIRAVPKSMIPTLLSKLDILYIGLLNQSVFQYGISPNKLIDYMMAGKPIIQAINAGNDMVSDAHCGISVEPENPEAIAAAIKYLISLPKEKLKKMGDSGRKYCLENHDYRILANKLINTFRGLFDEKQ